MAIDAVTAVGSSMGLSVALVTGALLQSRTDPSSLRSVAAWLLLSIGAVGPVAWVGARVGPALHMGLADAIWVSVAGTAAIFLVVSLAVPLARRLAFLVAAYVAVAGLLATLAAFVPEPGAVARVGPGIGSPWLALHIVLTIATYGTLTIAAIAGLSALLQEGALKRKRPTILTRRLPAVAESERLQVLLLGVSEGILALGLVTGIASQYQLDGRLMAIDHKSVLAIAAFIVIGLLLIAHAAFGVPGRRAARLVLAAYLLITLAFPGVKLVTDVILA